MSEWEKKLAEASDKAGWSVSNMNCSGEAEFAFEAGAEWARGELMKEIEPLVQALQESLKGMEAGTLHYKLAQEALTAYRKGASE